MTWSWALVEGWLSFLVSGTVFVLHLVVVCMALVRPHRSPASRVAWVAVIMFLPVVGIVAYLFLGETSIGREREDRLREAERTIALPEPGGAPGGDAAPTLDPATASVFDLVRSINGFPATAGNSVVLAPSADAAIDSLVADIAAAERTVHIGFYIWLDDHAGGRVADAVAEAARRGVACRIMVDALGSRAFVASPRWAQMRDAGAYVVAALDDIPRLGRVAVGRLDLRNHRKIAVIDGRVAYCGSRNCADPAFSPKPRFAPWVDVLFRCRGPIVAQEQWLFLTTWTAETGERVPDEAATAAASSPTASASSSAPGDAVAAMFGTGPTSRAGAMSEAFTTTIGAARERLVITTPYFAPDEPLLQAIRAAPQRGVRTTLVLPARNDSWLVAATARSLYAELLEAGVELYEYPLGLLHTKTMTVDGHLSLVGSANMDRRSLELNYENNLLVDSPEVAAAVLARQQEYLDASRRVAAEEVESWSLGRRLWQNAVAMLSPIL